MTLKLKSITLDNLSQVTVAPSASNAKDRSYGRRFTVTMGDDSQEVVLKDLFKKAQILAKNATSASELFDVNEFIVKLTDAETAASKIYKDRDDCVYKFRSWFHRFFGGAFLGSHTKRLGNLKTDVKGKESDLIESFKNVFLQNRQIFESIGNKGFEIQVGDQMYDVVGEKALSGEMKLNIQKKEDLGSDTGVLEIVLNNQGECILSYEGNADVVAPQLALILSEISNEVDTRELSNQNFLKSLTLVKAVAARLEDDAIIPFTYEGKDYLISRSPVAIRKVQINLSLKVIKWPPFPNRLCHYMRLLSWKLISILQITLAPP